MEFDNFKQEFTCAPSLIHNLEKPFIMKVDVPDFALGSVLSQIGDNYKLHSTAFH